MNNKSFLRKLEELAACDESREWVANHGGDFATLWEQCPRADWMGWLIARYKNLSFAPELLLANVEIMGYILKKVKTNNHALYMDALKAVRAFAKGKGSIEEVDRAANEVNAARYESYITATVQEFIGMVSAPRSSWGVPAYGAEAIRYYGAGSEEAALKHMGKFYRKYFHVGQRGLTTVKGVNNG